MTNQDYENLLARAINEYVYAANVDTYELLYVNEALCNHLNITDSDWEGKKCYEVMRLASKPCVFCYKDYIPVNETYSRYRHKRFDDTHLITKDKIIDDENGRILIQTSYDVSNEFMKIKTLKSSLHLNRAIISCAKTLLNEGSVQVNISKLLKIICEFYGGVCANVYELDMKTGTVECNYQYLSNNINELEQKDCIFKFAELKTWWDILEFKSVIYIPSIEERFDKNSEQYKLFEKTGVKSCIITTLKIDEQVSGVVVIDNPSIMYDSFDLLATASMFISNNLEKNRTVCHLENSVDTVKEKIDINEVLLECAHIFFEGTNTKDTITNILGKICEYFDADRISLLELSDEKTFLTNTYEYANSYCKPLIEELEGVKMPIPQFLFKDMLENPTIYVSLDDPGFDKDSVDYKVISRFEVPSLILTSLLINSEFSGLIAVHHPKQNKENHELLHTISGFILNEISKREIIKELETLSFLDKLTGLYNRNFYLHVIEGYERELPPKLGIIFADINGLKRANDNLGHEYGDALIKWCGNFLAKHNPNCVYRIGGDEFVCFIKDMECEDFYNHIQKMRLELHDSNLPNMSMGGTWSNGDKTIDSLIIETDKIMYWEKQKYYIFKNMTQINEDEELDMLKKLMDSVV